MKKLFLPSLLIASCLMLTACDNHPYKEELQRIYDYNNQTSNQAICMIVGKVPYANYPHTTFHMEDEDLPYKEHKNNHIAYYNRTKNEALHFFSKAGLLTEVEAEEDKGKPIYTYNLTDLGKKHFSGFRNQTNFCFGRIVIDSVKGTEDWVNNMSGGAIRSVFITYHVENVPDWVKTSEAYKLFKYPEKMVTGRKLEGENYYDILSDGRVKFRSSNGINRGYQWAYRSDSTDYPFKKEVEEKEAE